VTEIARQASTGHLSPGAGHFHSDGSSANQSIGTATADGLRISTTEGASFALAQNEKYLPLILSASFKATASPGAISLPLIMTKELY